jgi:hypothetical protein
MVSGTEHSVISSDPTSYRTFTAVDNTNMDVGDDPCSEDCPLEFNVQVQSFLIYSWRVECEDYLPASCADYLDAVLGPTRPAVTARNSCTDNEYDVFCTMLSSNAQVDDVSPFHIECEGVTAKRNSALGDGGYDDTDAALRIYGLSGAGITDSDYFVEDPSAPLFFEHTPNTGTARLTGTLSCRDNPAQILYLDATFDSEQNASEWLGQNTSNLLVIGNDPDESGDAQCNVDYRLVYVFKLAEGSYLQGGRDLSGVLALSHTPTSYSKRFQLGEGVNNHNCNYGLGGWFSWNGYMNGESVSGASGAIVIDLKKYNPVFERCKEYAEFVFTAIDLDCGRVLTHTARVDRDDTIAPVGSVVDASVPCAFYDPNIAYGDGRVNDNCSSSVVVSWRNVEQFDIEGTGCYKVRREYTFTDDCGNSSWDTQTITVTDETAPELTIPADYTAECSDDHPMDDASALSVGCSGEVTIDDVETTIAGACAGDYSITRAFTATDDCGNATSATQTITIVDTTAPVLTHAPEVSISCDEYSNEKIYATAKDNCGTSTITYSDKRVSGRGAIPVGQYLRTYTATDECGNSSTSTQTVTVQKFTYPDTIIFAAIGTAVKFAQRITNSTSKPTKKKLSPKRLNNFVKEVATSTAISGILGNIINQVSDTKQIDTTDLIKKSAVITVVRAIAAPST